MGTDPVRLFLSWRTGSTEPESVFPHYICYKSRISVIILFVMGG